jgi:16S rRNA A1518/A1519 N6-dimethyltransferase RsmA/KsgA/DIM1 with predicted DNA glycosylase/AP lyase activity
VRHFNRLYDAEYLFTVDEMFYSAPKVKSGVLRLRRKKDYSLPCGRNYFHGGQNSFSTTS